MQRNPPKRYVGGQLEGAGVGGSVCVCVCVWVIKNGRTCNSLANVCSRNSQILAATACEYSSTRSSEIICNMRASLGIWTGLGRIIIGGVYLGVMTVE